MAHALGVRTMSVAASAGLLGLLLFGALSVTMTLQRLDLPAPPPSVPLVNIDEEPPPPPIAEPASTPPQTPVTTDWPDVYDPPVATPPATMDYRPPATVTQGPPLITDPHWLRRPRNLARYYPRRALEHAVTGQVVLDCLVSVEGRLDCGVESESPAGWGFAEAALRIARDHRMAPAIRDGAATQSRYRMRVPFNLE